MRVIKFILPLLIVAFGAGIFVYLNSGKSESPPLEQRSRPPIVSVQTIEKGSVAPTVRLFGQVETPSLVTLTAGIEADVTHVRVREGNRVEQAQVLVELDRLDSQLAVLQRQADVAEIRAQLDSDSKRHAADLNALASEKILLDIARKEVERAQKLMNNRAGTAANLDIVLKAEQRQLLAMTLRRQSIDDFSSRQRLWQARLDKAEAALQSAMRDLARSRVAAPFAGRVVQVTVSPGERVQRGRQLLQMYDDTQLEIRTQVPNRYVTQLKQALNADLPIRAQVYETGTEVLLDRVAASVDRGQGGVDAFFRTDQPLPELGRTLELELQLQPIADAVLLDTDALYGSNRVYLVRDQQLHSMPIQQLGERRVAGERLLVIDGADFDNGDQILSSRLPQAIDGLAVKVAP